MKNKQFISIFSIEYFSSKNDTSIPKSLIFSLIDLYIALVFSAFSVMINFPIISEKILILVFNK